MEIHSNMAMQDEQRALEVKPQWLVMHCATPGCFTAIRMKLGQLEADPICKWCQAGESHAKMGKPSVDSRFKESMPNKVISIQCQYCAF